MKNYSKANAEIGARIQEIRLKRNMTQETLAEKAGICNPQQMSNIERGLAGLSVPRLIDVCKVLNIEADFILFGHTDKSVETVLHDYIKKMNPDQLNNLIELVKVYAKSCGIEWNLTLTLLIAMWVFFLGYYTEIMVYLLRNYSICVIIKQNI